jgi:Zn ribbon nucleic-acid-binding protein
MKMKNVDNSRKNMADKDKENRHIKGHVCPECAQYFRKEADYKAHYKTHQVVAALVKPQLDDRKCPKCGRPHCMSLKSEDGFKRDECSSCGYLMIWKIRKPSEHAKQPAATA